MDTGELSSKVLPHSTEAEKSVLGAMLQSDAAQHCLGLLAAKGITPVSIEEITLRNEKL